MTKTPQKDSGVNVKSVAADSLVMAFGFAAGLFSISGGPTGALAAIQLKNSIFHPSKMWG